MSSDHKEAIEALAKNDVRIEPSARVRGAAAVKDYDTWYARWENDPDAFWAAAASELAWFEKWRKVSDIDLPHHEWFVGRKLNLSYNCLERNIARGLGDKIALYCESEGEPPRSFTYRQTLAEVAKVANSLKSLGVKRGDRVILYMPLSPEGLFAMHACARIGAIHSVVYAGIGAESLRNRIDDCRRSAPHRSRHHWPDHRLDRLFGARMGFWVVMNPDIEFLLPALAVLVGGGIAVFSALDIAGGIGLLNYRNWARILVLITSVPHLLNMPIGTAIGNYSIVILVHSDTQRLFENPNAVGAVLPQPPAS